MADILSDLYLGYETDLATYMASGQDLDWIHYAAAPGEVDLTELWGLLPCLLYFWTETPFVKNAGEGRCRADDKIYYFQMNCIFEMQDISYATNSPSVPKVREHIANAKYIEDIFNRNTFNVSMASWQTRMWSGAPTFPGFTMEGLGWIYSVNFEFAHLWHDYRSS